MEVYNDMNSENVEPENCFADITNTKKAAPAPATMTPKVKKPSLVIEETPPAAERPAQSVRTQVLEVLSWNSNVSLPSFVAGNIVFLSLPSIMGLNLLGWMCAALLMHIPLALVARILAGCNPEFPTITAQNVSGFLVQPVTSLANHMVALYRQIFWAEDTEMAIAAVVSLWAVSVISSHISPLNFLHTAFVAAFVLPRAYQEKKEMLMEVKSKVEKEVQVAWEKVKGPPVFLVLFGLFYLSGGMTKIVLVTVAALGFKVHHKESSTCQETTAEISKVVKKKARRISVGAHSLAASMQGFMSPAKAPGMRAHSE